MTTKITAYRYHDISCGHRVVGHESRCKHLHGHNYRMHFYCEAPALDELGRVIDFGVIKSTLCEWLEQTWDHKTLLWKKDPLLVLFGAGEICVQDAQKEAIPEDLQETTAQALQAAVELTEAIVLTSFNPTAEALAQHLLEVVGPACLAGTGVVLAKVVVDETRKCSAVAELVPPAPIPISEMRF